jgi:hypothetical protein
MENRLCKDFAVHYGIACGLVRKLMTAFTKEQWHAGVSDFETPVNLAYHTIECLDYFFYEGDRKDFSFGYRFGGSWWQLDEEKKPGIDDLTAYLDEMEERIVSFFNGSEDAHLAEAFDDKQTNMGWYLYALRHTLHHQGGLNALAAYHKIDVGGWDGE